MKIDPARLAEEVAGNADVLRQLAENGDVSIIMRTIDVHFKGARSQCEILSEEAEGLGFEFVDFGEYEDGDWACDLSVISTTDEDAITDLTRRALMIELTHGVEFDGWGCNAVSGPNS